MVDAARNTALVLIREFLESLPGSATVAVRRQGEHGRRMKLPWSGPRPPDRRKAEWPVIRRHLETTDTEASVWVAPEGWDELHCYEVTWPAPTDLFATVDPPADPEPPRVVRPDATGRPVPVEPPHAPAGETRLTPLVMLERPSRASIDCARHVIVLLHQQQHRLTGSRIVEELERRRQVWVISTVETTLSWLQAHGLVTNGRDARGKGYGLVRWDRPEEEYAVLLGDGDFE